MFYLIYVSAAVRPMSEAELLEILETSRRNNEVSGLTGMLFYKEIVDADEASFMQLLEGEEAAVMETYRRIVQDKRHDTLIILERGPVEDRAFPDWSMGFRTVRPEDLARIPGFAHIKDESFDSPAFRNLPDGALDLMKTFYETIE